MFSPAARLTLNPSPATSESLFEFEYPCIVEIYAFLIPYLSSRVFNTGPAAILVFDPSEITFESKLKSSDQIIGEEI